MKKLVYILCMIYSASYAYSQDIPPVAEQQLESIANTEEPETEDDSYLQQLTAYRNDPINLNTADRNELAELHILNDLQIGNLIAYRRLLGPIIDIHELQAIPAWNIPVIRKLLPFVTVTTSPGPAKEWSRQLREGQHSILIRISQVIEKASNTAYAGGPQKLFVRYRYQYKNLLQYGLTGDKDAGEQFFKGSQARGFDFYSFHVFIRQKGIIRSLALGDFTVNMGQGLIQWQSLAFKKSAEAMGIKRQSPVLRPYNSAGEFNFHRGVGITLQKTRWETTLFVSFHNLGASLDTIVGKTYFTSFQTSGYHRTIKEIRDKNDLRQTALGGNIHYKHNRWQAGVNMVYYKFSAQMKGQDELYDLFAATGDHWYNISLDYSYQYRNLHVFGEAAIDINLHKAILNGILVSVDPKIDISILYRSISKAYQSIQGNAFTENTFPANENGLYAGITIRPSSVWELNAYTDMYNFPWLKYLVDAPSSGRDFFVQLTYTPNKQTELYTRFKNELKTGNRKQNWRTNISYAVSRAVTLRKRIELTWYNKEQQNSSTGFLAYVDVLYKPLLKPFSAILRLQYFETDNYDTRLYAYENDVLYSYSIPAFYGKGYRYALTMQYDISKKISCWLRWARTLYTNQSNELKVQGRIVF